MNLKEKAVKFKCTHGEREMDTISLRVLIIHMYFLFFLSFQIVDQKLINLMLNRFNCIDTESTKSMRNFVHLLLTFDKIMMKTTEKRKQVIKSGKAYKLCIYVLIYIYQVLFQFYWICGKSLTDRPMLKLKWKIDLIKIFRWIDCPNVAADKRHAGEQTNKKTGDN